MFAVIDSFLIAPFRMGIPTVWAFWLGTAILCLYCVLLGELCFLGVYRFNRGYYLKLNQKMTRMHNISVEAIRHKNKQVFKDANLWANEYFGKVFFSQVALFSVSLCPVPFALAWLQYRFSGITIHSVLHLELGYAFVFVVSYILVRYLFSRIRRFIPLWKRLDQMRAEDAGKSGPITSWSELGSENQKTNTPRP